MQKVWSNFHTHSTFCDGAAEPQVVVESAINNGMQAIGFSSHAPVPFETAWAIKSTKELQRYAETIKNLKQNYSDKIEIYLGLECDYIPGITEDFANLKKWYNLDYIIGSVHLVKESVFEKIWFIDGPIEGYEKGLKEIFESNALKAVTAFFHQTNEMIISQKPDIIGHLDKVRMYNKKRFFTEEEKWYKDLVLETLENIKKFNCIVEINTRGIYKKRTETPFPDHWIIRKCKELSIPVTISSDAHLPQELTYVFEETATFLKDVGYKEIAIIKQGTWTTQNL